MAASWWSCQVLSARSQASWWSCQHGAKRLDGLVSTEPSVSMVLSAQSQASWWSCQHRAKRLDGLVSTEPRGWFHDSNTPLFKSIVWTRFLEIQEVFWYPAICIFFNIPIIIKMMGGYQKTSGSQKSSSNDRLKKGIFKRWSYVSYATAGNVTTARDVRANSSTSTMRPPYYPLLEVRAILEVIEARIWEKVISVTWLQVRRVLFAS